MGLSFAPREEHQTGVVLDTRAQAGSLVDPHRFTQPVEASPGDSRMAADVSQEVATS
jgi:hypothetical protein